MSRQTPNIRFTWRISRVPTGTDEYRFSFQPLGQSHAFHEPRLRTVSPITRRASSDEGDSHSPSVDVTFDDADGLMRGILSDSATRHGGGEGAIEIVSETGRKAGVPWSDLFRGRVVNPQAPGDGDRLASLRIEGAIGSLFTGLDLNKTIPSRRIGAEHPNAPESSKGLVYPFILGEHTDVGAQDAFASLVEKGVLPAIDVGDVFMLPDGTEVDPEDGEPVYLAAPTNLGAVVNGTPGTRTVTYDVTALSLYGETPAATLVVDTAPEILNGTDNVELTWDADPSGETIAYRVYRNKKRVVLLNNGGSFSTPETTYTDIGVESVAPGPPSVNTAQVAVDIGGEEAFAWTRFVAAGKAVHLEYVYASDLADGVPPKRMRLTAEHMGTEVLKPGEAGWPHATDHLDIGGIRQTVFYMRGPRVAQHRAKTVTIAWSGWGIEDVGDGTGDPIIQAFPGLLVLLNEEVLKNDGEGYATGLYGPLETFSNGVAKLRSSAFLAAQDLTRQFVGTDVGYAINLAITEPVTVRELIRRFHVTFGSYDATTRLGQWFPWLVNDLEAEPEVSSGLSPLQDEDVMTSGNLGDETSASPPPTGAYALGAERRAYRDTVNISRWVGQTIHHDKAQTEVSFDFSWDADAQRFRMPDQKIAYDHTAYGHTEPKRRPKRRAYYTHDPATAFDAQDRWLRRRLIAPRDVQFAVDLEGLDDEIGNEAWITHYKGAGSSAGDVETRMQLIGHDPNPMAPEEVVLTFRDLTRIVPNALSPLQDETLMTEGNLGDEEAEQGAGAAHLGAG